MRDDTEKMTDLEYILQILMSAAIKVIKNGINSVMQKLKRFTEDPDISEETEVDSEDQKEQ